MPRRTKAEAEATRASIIDAAIDVFLEKGVSRATLEQIARRAGVTRGAVYWHFRDKNDLFSALIERARLPMDEVLANLRATNDDDPLRVLQSGATHALNMLQESDDHRRISAILFTRCEFVSDINPTVDAQNQHDAEVLAEVTKDFEAAARLGLLRSGLAPRVAAVALLTQVRGIYHTWLQNPDLFDLRREGVASLELFFAAVRA